MKDFIDKWNSDHKFKTKIKLSLYTLFVVLVSIFAVSNRNNIQTDEIEDYNTNNNSQINTDKKDYILEIPNEYDYTINITINDNNYKYTGTKNTSNEEITKEMDGVINNYIYKNNSYYKEEDEKYILTTKTEVYDIIEHNYIELETINEYLSKSTKEGNQYLVYIKDIILGNESEEYIIITPNNNKIDIDYTSLMKKFDKSIEKFLVKIEIEEIE